MFNGPKPEYIITTYPTRADRIFVWHIPPPPCWPNLAPFSVDRTPLSLQWKECEKSKYRLSKMIKDFQIYNRKRMIHWPLTEEYISPTLSPSEYFYALMRPIPEFFNQSGNKNRVKTPIGFAKVDFGNSIYGAAPPTAEFDEFETSPPMIVALPGKLFNTVGMVTSRVENALRKILDHNKVIATGCTLEAHHYSVDYFSIPEIEREVDETLVHPEGPPQYPAAPLLPDEQVFASCHRNLDFDHATLVRDRERALQFFRWNKHIRQTKTRLVAHTKDTLSAATHRSEIITPPEAATTPVYLYDPSDLPPDTMTHLQSVRRDSPLVTAGLADALQKSKSFLVMNP